MWIYQISEEENKAVLEDDLGFYLARYDVDYQNKKISLAGVVFESELVTPLGAIGDDPDDHLPGEKRYDRIYTRDAKGMESYSKIEGVLVRHYFPSAVELDTDRTTLILVENIKNHTYSVIENNELDEKIFLEIIQLAAGNPVFLRKIVKPLNSVLLMYSRAADKKSTLVATRLAQRTISSIKEAMGLGADDDFTWQRIKELDRNFLESAQARIYVLATLVDAVADATGFLVKDRCRLVDESGWLKFELRSNKRFNLSKFKEENPVLYEKYLIETGVPVLVKQGRSKAKFPLPEDELRNQIGRSFKALE